MLSAEPPLCNAICSSHAAEQGSVCSGSGLCRLSWLSLYFPEAHLLPVTAKMRPGAVGFT